MRASDRYWRNAAIFAVTAFIALLGMTLVWTVVPWMV